MMPSPEVLAAAFAAKGIGDDSRVVLYSRETIQWATRVWWMLRAIGVDNASVLNGGFDKWQAEGRPISTDPVDYPVGTLTARPRAGLFCDKDDVPWHATLSENLNYAANTDTLANARGTGVLNRR